MAASDSESETCPCISPRSFESAARSLLLQYNGTFPQCTPEAIYLEELPSYDEFFCKFLIPNQLCVLSEKATKKWRSRNEWVCLDGSPNFDFLQDTFGNTTVPVADCKHKEFSAHAKKSMEMREFVQYWRQLRESGHPIDQESLYLKDWHFTRAFPDYKAYSTCPFFCSDWMNEFWDVWEDCEDDYRFVYMGPKGTWTPLHADVFRSFSWSANICGRKQWIFFPPGEEEYLKDVHGNLAYDVTSSDLSDPRKFPNACKAQHRIEIIQHPGETIFVPSSWHHQVTNLEDTISINHNWLNGSNVRLCWDHLKTSLADVQQEIIDCRNMEGWDYQCQKILRAFSGLDYAEFFRFMWTIARNRILTLHDWQRNIESSASSQRDSCRYQKDTENEAVNCECEEVTCRKRDDTLLNLNCFGQSKERSTCSSSSPSSIAHPHWSWCNLNHVLFDLVSLALVVKDMSRTPEMTLALLNEVGYISHCRQMKSVCCNTNESANIGKGEKVGLEQNKVKNGSSDLDTGTAKGDLELDQTDTHLVKIKVTTAGPELKENDVAFSRLNLSQSSSCCCKMCTKKIVIFSCEELMTEIVQTLSQFGVGADLMNEVMGP